MSFREGRRFTPPPNHAGVDPKFSAAAAFGAPNAYFGGGGAIKKRRRRRDRRSAGLYTRVPAAALDLIPIKSNRTQSKTQ